MLAFLLLLMMTSTMLCTSCTNAPQQDQPLRIAYIAKLTSESFHDGIAAGVRKEMAKLGVRVDIFPADNQQDVTTQQQKLASIATQKNYQGVMLAPNDSEALIPSVKALDDVGIPFIVCGCSVGSECRAFIGLDSIRIRL